MAKQEPTLLQSAAGKLRISRLGALTMLVVDGQGLALTTTAEFSVVQKWAQSKAAGPNATLSMAKIIEKLDVLVCRQGTTFAATRGSIKPLEVIVKGIMAAGMDLKEFSLPPELKDAGRPVDQVLAAKAAGESKAAKAAAEAGVAPPPVAAAPPPPPPPRPAEPESTNSKIIDFRKP